MPFNYKIKSVETEYKGMMFRSRLEATWAAFFDELGWDWEYEPFDLEGWFPDFRLTQKGNKGSILVEVKPTYFDSQVHLKELKDKIRKAYPGEILVLGNAPHTNAFSINDLAAIGVFISEEGEFADFWSIGPYDAAVLNYMSDNHGNKFFDLCACEGSYQMRFSLMADGNKFLAPVKREFIDLWWGQAKSKTQYKNKRWKR